MKNKFKKTDYILWAVIIVYTGIIYATLSVVSKIRKTLVEKYGPDVFDKVYWIFGIIALVLLCYIFCKLKGKRLVFTLISIVIISAIYAYYLTSLKYAVERIHFLEYGLLGALVYMAFKRHIQNWLCIPLSLAVVYWLGLGDEAIQWALPSRVGEISDSVINLISGILGIALILVTLPASFNQTVRINHMRYLLVFTGITALLTALFLYKVHGFGYKLENRDPGRIYSSFSQKRLDQINKPVPDKYPTADYEQKIYENEALRHLLQREYYFTNDLSDNKGGYYRNYYKAYFENRVMEIYYSRFLTENALKDPGDLLKNLDSEVAASAAGNPMIWPDSLEFWVKNWFGNPNSHFISRVKGTIITSFDLGDLFFYITLILLMLIFIWFKLPNKETITNNEFT
ncbi:MAG: VanZ family protein [bacterium]